MKRSANDPPFLKGGRGVLTQSSVLSPQSSYSVFAWELFETVQAGNLERLSPAEEQRDQADFVAVLELSIQRPLRPVDQSKYPEFGRNAEFFYESRRRASRRRVHLLLPDIHLEYARGLHRDSKR